MPSEDLQKKPPMLLVIGMAGSGKTTLLQRLNAHIRTVKQKPYVLNLDPAVNTIPYSANIDIRDTRLISFRYELGPNGAILTCLNLFSTRFDKVMEILETRSLEIDYFLCDTPGQIEIFTWSASGTVISELLASSFPTIVVYVIDTPRCESPVTFMSNMLYACSIFYKTRLPLLVVFNKTDIIDPSFAFEWMTDFEAFQEAIEKDTSYASSLARSLSLSLEEFYHNMKTVAVSAVSGEGTDEFLIKVEEAVSEYYEHYLPELEELKTAKQEEEQLKEESGDIGKDSFIIRRRNGYLDTQDDSEESTNSQSSQENYQDY